MAAEDHKDARLDYESGMKYKDIAEKYSVSINTVKSWQKRFNWTRKKGAPETEKGCTLNVEGVHPKTDPEGVPKKKTAFQPGNKLAVGHGAPKGNKNAKGNKGGHGGPAGNNYATKHGFFKRIFPDDQETMEILAEIQMKSPLEIIWEQIVIQYTAIALSQKKMWVESKDEHIMHLKRERRGKNPEKEWEFQYSWDRQGNFLQAQSRAMQTLERLIARYEEMLLKELSTEEQQLRVDKLKAEVEKIKNPAPDADMTNYVEALKSTAEEVWADEDQDKEDDPEGEADE